MNKEEGGTRRVSGDTIFVGRISSGKNGFWRSFENDDSLRSVKKRIQTRCIPCIENLYSKLKAGQVEIDLGNAYNCWKVVAVLNSDEECEKVLEKYQMMFLPSRHIQGRYGSLSKDGTKAIVLNADDETERDHLFSELKQSVEKSGLSANIFISKGCANLYGQLFGDWQTWRLVSEISNTENVSVVMEILERYLGFA